MSATTQYANALRKMVLTYSDGSFKFEAPCSKLQGIFDCKEFYNF
jgi:hypothetical protein